jgi:hypothetical protein
MMSEERAKRRKVEEPASPAAGGTPAVVSTPTRAPAPAAAAATEPKTPTAAPTPSKEEEKPTMAVLLTGPLTKDDPAEVVSALSKLERAWYNSQKACKEAAVIGAPLSIVTILRKWENNEDVLRVATLCMVHLTYHLEDTRNSFQELGAAEVMAAAMNKFPENADINEFGCNFFYNLFLGAKGANKKSKEFAAKFAKDLNGIDVIVKTLKQFTDKKHTALQMNAFAALEELAAKGCRQQVIDAGAVRAVAPIFDTKPKNKEVERAAKSLMKSLFGK